MSTTKCDYFCESSNHLPFELFQTSRICPESNTLPYHGTKRFDCRSRNRRAGTLQLKVLQLQIRSDDRMQMAAIALREQGHDVTLLESSRFSNETGAAIHMAPNANGLLKRYGVDIEKVGANECSRIAQYHAESGKALFQVDLTMPNKQWQHKWLLVHRAHLHNALRERAIGKEGKGKPATLRLASKVASVDPEKAEVTLESGEKVSGDVLLGADGVHVSRSNFLIIQESSSYISSRCVDRLLCWTTQRSTHRLTAVTVLIDSWFRKRRSWLIQPAENLSSKRVCFA